MATGDDLASLLRMKDMVAIVTGGCKGIGRGIVDVFGKDIIPRLIHALKTKLFV